MAKMLPFPEPFQYLVLLYDGAAAAAAQAAYPNGLNMGPRTAATLFGVPIFNLDVIGPAWPGPPGYIFFFDYVSGTLIGQNWPLILTAATGYYDPTAVWPGIRQTTTPSGIPLVPPAFYEPQDYYWNGYVITVGSGSIPSPDLVANIPARRWAQGFEFLHGANASGNNSFNTRFSSRTVEGMGVSYQAGMGAMVVNNAPIANMRDGWDRFYLRVRSRPIGDDLPLWGLTNVGEGLNAAGMVHLNPAGQLVCRSVGNSTYPGTTMGTSSALTLNQWYKIDIFWRFPTSTPITGGGFFRLYIGGALAVSYTVPIGGSGGGMGSNNGASNNSAIAQFRPTIATQFAVDFDDWIGADLPIDTNGSVSTNSPDFKAGSHVRTLFPSGFSSLHNGSWVGDWRGLWVIGGGAGITTAVTGITASVVTQYPGFPQSGVIAVVANHNSQSAVAGNATLGCRIGGVTYTGPVRSFLSNIQYGNVFNVGTGSQTPNLNAPIDINFTRSASAGSHVLSALVGAAEFMGFWGNEDLPPGSHPEIVPAPFTGVHNSGYPESPEALATTRTIGTVASWAGTWTGDGIGKEIPTPVPLHWIFHRPASGSTGSGGRWWPTMLGAHAGAEQLLNGNHVAATLPPSGAPSPAFRVVGAASTINQAGIVYYVTGFSDATARFLLSTVLRWPSNTSSFTQPNGIPLSLWDPTFTPDGVLLFMEDGGASSQGFRARDPGHTTDQVSFLSGGGLQSGVLTTGTGLITSKTPLHGASYYDCALALFRNTDGAGNSGACAVVTYTGDGLSSRNIAVNLNYNSPMFALAVPHSAATPYFRDAYHTGLDSSPINSSGFSTDRIIGGGINYVTVGANMNINGVVYGLFVLAGCPKPGGFSDPGLCFPLAPAMSTGPLPDPRPPAPPTPPGPGTPTAPPVPVATEPVLGPCMVCTTLTDAITLLSLRLHDQGLVHWTAAELTRYLLEAVRTWNALTSSNTAQGTFNTTLGLPFYDLPTVLPTLRAYNLLDRDLVTDTEYALMETINVTAWSGTLQFILTDLVKALEHRRDRFLFETGMVVRRLVDDNPTPNANGRFDIDPAIMNIRRMAYIPTTGALAGVPYPLYRDDEWSLQSFLRTWNALGTTPDQRHPMVYSVGVTPQGPPITIQLAPPLTTGGRLDMIVISRAPVGGDTTPCLDPTVGIHMGIPDDWCWVVKFGALAEILGKQGVSYDPQRAAYCEARWQHGIQMASKASVTLAARINGQPIQVDNLSSADSFNRTWQQAMTVPSQAYLTGTNLLALAPVPDTALHTVTLDVVRNAIVPAVDTDCLGAEAQILDGILDYAQHLALFKEGPDQLKQSMDLLDRFFRMCGTSLSITWASVPNTPPIMNQSRRDEEQLPRIMVTPPSQVAPGNAPGNES